MEKIQKKCDICGDESVNLCLTCFSYFCNSCYKFVHEKSINSQHKKEIIDSYIPIETKCPYHPKNLLNLFCVDEKGK